jgi:sporulation integral membrane protein YtvI
MKEKVKVYASWVIVGFGALLVLYVFFKYVFGVIFPFLIGWAAALLVRRPARGLRKYTRVHEGTLRLVLAALAVGSLGALAVFGVRGLLGELSHLVSTEGGGALTALTLEIENTVSRLPAPLESAAERIFAVLEETLASAVPLLISSLARFLPTLLLSVAVGVIAAVYFCLDLDRIHGAVMRLIPQSWRLYAEALKKSALRAAFTVLRANVILMLIAFFFMLVGFLFLGVSYPLLLSGIFALFDFLPVIGVGTFLVPWGVWLLLTGEIGRGAGILVIFVVITVARQLAEPHLIGAGYGMHPLLTLLSMYAGARLFGAVGIILLPMAAVLLYGILFPPEEKQKKKAAVAAEKSERRC